MSARGTRRLAEIFCLLEQHRAVELRISEAALCDASLRCAAERAQWTEADRQSRDALHAPVSAKHAGSAAGWIAGEGLKAVGVLRLAQRARQQQVCAAQQVQAAADHAQSRQMAEQVGELARRLADEARLLADRREQAAADDRFLARRGRSAGIP